MNQNPVAIFDGKAKHSVLQMEKKINSNIFISEDEEVKQK